MRGKGEGSNTAAQSPVSSATMAASNGSDWCTIESDPGVFTSLIQSFGVENGEVAELYSLDDDSLLQLIQPIEGVQCSVHGLIFLFKWQSSSEKGNGNGKDTTPLVGEACPPGLFFAKQCTHNACATQAILSVLLNATNSIIERDEIEGGRDATKAHEDDANGRKLVLGKIVSDFSKFTSHFPPDLRGEAIGSSEEIRTAHNSFGRAEDTFLSDPTRQRVADDDDDIFHFIAYVPHNGGVYELDGLQEGPIRVGSFERENDNGGGDSSNGEKSTVTTSMNWIRVARDAIKDRLSCYSSTEIKFNLMALVQDKRTYLTERLNALAAIGMEESDPSMLAIRSKLQAEEEKRARWMAENARRRHNYLPFCVELLRSLTGNGAEEGKLDKLVAMAKNNSKEKKKRTEAWKKSSEVA